MENSSKHLSEIKQETGQETLFLQLLVEVENQTNMIYQNNDSILLFIVSGLQNVLSHFAEALKKVWNNG